ncbi:MAG: exopolysaccharide biosynthesis polyprenyl glycosylphosphotransferase [Myxococcales bacterium]|nr:exopolysaccharide biosynthesis polyprenyl glycosylphosphotransferase [Myxococcales bacterium]
MSTRAMAIAGTDMLLALSSVALAGSLVLPFYPSALIGLEAATIGSAAIVLTAVLTSYLVGLHDPSVITDDRQIVARSIVVGILSALAGMLTIYGLWLVPVGRIPVVVNATVVASAVAGVRTGFRWYLLRGPKVPVLVHGSGTAALRFAELINRSPRSRYRVIGCVGEEPPNELGSERRLPHLGAADRITEICAHRGVAMVAVVGNGLNADSYRRLGALQLDGVRVTTSGALAMEVAKQIPLDIVTSRYLLDAFERLDSPVVARVKRVMDLGLAIAGLAVFGLMFPLLYLLVKLDSRGPFFYSQERLGAGGRIFRLHKIRTMGTDQDPAEQRWASRDDARVTRIGRILRRLRIDEFPNFYNVLRGEMSVVGPRPEQPKLARELEERVPAFAYRTLVKPGITGWAQIHHGYAASVEDSATKLAYDLYYVRKQSVMLDLDIVLRTVFVMLARVGSR